MSAPTTIAARTSDAEPAQTGINEPSMEDILASIRRIIAEDQSNNVGRSAMGGLTRRMASAPQSFAVEPAVLPAPDETTRFDVAVPPQDHEAYAEPGAGPSHDLLHEGFAASVDVTQAPASDGRHPVYAPETAVAPAEPVFEMDSVYEPEPIAEAYADTVATDRDPEPLMSVASGASISSSFQTLAESVMLQDPGLIERVMRESLRPLLKAWLDDHLPRIVERLVRSEIERVARGARSRDN